MRKYEPHKHIPARLRHPTPLRNFFRNAMEKQGITQEKLAKRLYVSAPVVSVKFYRTPWRDYEIREWCKALGITDAKALGEAILAENEYPDEETV